jgi:hypothetical protein
MLSSKDRRRRFRVAVGLTKGKVGMGPVGGAPAIAPMLENMIANMRAMRLRYGADKDVDLPAQARLLEFDALTMRGLSAPFGGAFDSADMFYLPGADGAAGSLRVLRHDEANPADRKALRAALLEEGYVPVDEVSVMTLPGLAAECAAKRAAAAERATAAVAAESAAADAAAAARSAAAIRASLSRGAPEHAAVRDRGAPVAPPLRTAVPLAAPPPPVAPPVAPVAPPVPPVPLAAPPPPPRLPPFAVCDVVRDMERGDGAHGPLVHYIEDGKLKPAFAVDKKLFEHRMIQYVAIRYYRSTETTANKLLKFGRIARQADATLVKFKSWYAITVHVVREARGGRLDNTAV